jgi:AraC family transcriptional regulator
MSIVSQVVPVSPVASAAGLRELADSVIWLLRTATREVERDHEAAKTFIARASSLLQIEVDRNAPSDRGIRSGGLAPWQAQRVQAFIEEHLSEPVRVDDLSELVRLSRTHFSRAFRQVFGETPHAYVVRQRVDRVCRLMLTSDSSLSELALACGFADQAHLCRQFRRATGKSPAAWRRERRQAARPKTIDGGSAGRAAA